jgi:hypothetical protein
MALNSSADVCNLTLSLLGNYGTVGDIDTPQGDKEQIFAKWYDISRQSLIKQLVPNFAISRKRVARVVQTPPFGYEYVYEYPNNCLKLLGIDEVDDKAKDYAVEGGYIYSDTLYDEGMPIRYLKDITDVNSQSPEFKVLHAHYMASLMGSELQKPERADAIERKLPMLMASFSAINAQENPPIRISHSKFKMARTRFVSRNPVRK